MRLTLPLSVLAAGLIIAGASACQREASPTVAPVATPPAAASVATDSVRPDEHSFAEPDKVRTTDVALDLKVDFAQKQLSGSATYTLDWLDPKYGKLVLDTRDITIEKIVGERADGKHVGDPAEQAVGQLAK